MSNDTTPDSVTIKGVEYVPVSSIPTPAGPPPETRIIVADRGWVFVGQCEDSDVGVTIQNARCIRVWGTNESKPGLGWLALNGPTSKTKLDASGTVRVPLHALVASFDTDGALWS